MCILLKIKIEIHYNIEITKRYRIYGAKANSIGLSNE